MAQKFDKNVRQFTNSTAVSVDSTADLITAASTDRISVLIQNASASTDVYLGDSTVTTSKGIKLAAGQSFLDERSSAAWYGVTASGTADIRVVVFY